jgi:hypothetical protein
MPEQNYNNHIRYYTPHHFVFYPALLVLIIIGLYGLFNYPGQELLWIMILLLLVAIGCLSLMLRQHYALMNQNRIVRLELRFRYYVLTQKRLEPLEKQLSRGQLHALRFASDEELPALLERALKENLSPDAIKRAIKNWLPDEMRV